MKMGFWEILVIAVLFLILFGHSKIPDFMKNLASGINIFKKELGTPGKDEKNIKPEIKAPAKKKNIKKSPVKSPIKTQAKMPPKKVVSKKK